MATKLYQFLCDHCGYKRFTDGTDIQDLVQVKTSPIPGGAPQLDPLAQKTATPMFGQPSVEVTKTLTPQAGKQKKRFKCPKCGYVIMARQVKEEVNETNIPNGRETGAPRSPLPGELA